jgi:hypothetical protein
MSGLEVLGLLSAALSIFKGCTDLIRITQERRSFRDHVKRAQATANVLQWSWPSLRQQLEAARQEGLCDSQLTEHEIMMDRTLEEAYDSIKELLNPDKTANIKILLGCWAEKLTCLNACLNYLLMHQQTLEGFYLRFG